MAVYTGAAMSRGQSVGKGGSGSLRITGCIALIGSSVTAPQENGYLRSRTLHREALTVNRYSNAVETYLQWMFGVRFCC